MASPFSFLTRRRALKLGFGGLGVAFMGGGGLWALRGSADHVDGLSVLSDHEFRTCAAIARTQLPRGGPFAEGAEDFELARAFDSFLADEPKKNVEDLQAALFLVEYGPVFFDRGLTTFSNLGPAARLAHWQGWQTSDLLLRRKVSIAFRKFFSLVFFDSEPVWASIGYPGPSLANPSPGPSPGNSPNEMPTEAPDTGAPASDGGATK